MDPDIEHPEGGRRPRRRLIAPLAVAAAVLAIGGSAMAATGGDDATTQPGASPAQTQTHSRSGRSHARPDGTAGGAGRRAHHGPCPGMGGGQGSGSSSGDDASMTASAPTV
jgi:hypothetical protein